LVIIGITAFLTVVDLFATQAILPALAGAYHVSPATMGLAVNASTIGMAVAGLGVALLGHRINRHLGILLSLLMLSVPTALLASMPALPIFTALRIIQGLFMASAFTLTLAYLAEQCNARDAASAFAAYVTGNVASNLFGRLLAANAVNLFGLSYNFYLFAALNVAGAVLVFITLRDGRVAKNGASLPGTMMLSAWSAHLRNPPLRAAFALGFCILFAFIGTFTYVNFVLVRPPFTIGMMMLGFVYFVFLPSIVSTPLAGRVVVRLGTRTTCWGALALAGIGLPLLLLPSLSALLLGLVLVGIGTFFAQATATGFVGRAATADRAAAGGLYLACYFSGGLAGTAALGRLFDAYGWSACVGGIGIALLVAIVLARHLKLPASSAFA
jgi:predicted MFS family arabinose efflux permease